MSYLFHKTHEQSYVAHVIGYSLCIGPYANQKECRYHRTSNMASTSKAGFAGGTFFGGMVLMLLLVVLGFVGHKYYKKRQVYGQFERTRLTSISTF